MTQQEEWRPVPGHDGYEVSNLGRVTSFRKRTPKVLSASYDRNGYPRIRLAGESGMRTRLVPHLVAEAFHGPRPAGMVVRHLNGDPRDNRAENLRWGTYSENVLDSIRHGTHVATRKTHCPQSHPYDEANTKIYRGMRYCRACVPLHTAARKQRVA